ncbi:MAG: Crossover junction endodeoxyribonuclease RuvC [Cellulomonadaceae bacterium TMED98]|nr:MAG: Crossover junction endodeoxyribonuclease RuvC [Cellulomonadaceae bacterium TMED98]
MTRILGVDPGLTRLGVGVIDHSRGRDVSLVMVDVFTTPTDWDVAKRLLSLQGQLREVLDEFQPARVSLERVFAQHNVRTVMGTAQVSGIVLALAAERGIPVAHRTPSEVKAAVTGFGGAKKPQVGQMVKTILQLDQVPKPADAADALALAITEAWRGSPVVGEDRPETPAQRAWREALRPRGT